MAADAPPPAPAAPRRRHPLARAAAWAGAVLLALLLLIAAGIAALNTAPGRRLVASEVSQLVKPNSGLRIHVLRIDGSIYGRMVLRGLQLSDAQGVFLTAPQVTVDWRPLALVGKHLVLNEVAAQRVEMARRPALKPSAPNPNRPLLPNFPITLGRLRIGSLVLDPPVSGQERDLALSGSADLVRGRAVVNLDARARPLPGAPGGDQALVRLDAEPKANRLRIDLHLSSPKGGIVDGLAKLDAPFALDLHGQGDWRDWRGRAQAAVGGAPILDARLSANDGLFHAAGRAEPGRLIKAAAKLTSPALDFDLSGRVVKRVVSLNARLSSSQFRALVSGGIDARANVLHGVHADITLLDPSELSPNLTGKDVHAVLTLDGPLARPLVDYDLTAAALGFGKLEAQDVRASGRSQLQGGGAVTIPVRLTAARVTGVSKSAGPLTDVSLKGPVQITRAGGISAALQLGSSRFAARVNVKGSLRTGEYAGLLRARMDAAAVRQFGLGSVLGGPASLSADFARSRSVTVRLTNLRLDSPQLRVSNGQATLFSDGRIAASASAVSSRYGAAQLTVGGTMKALQAHLSAPNPKLPVPVTNLQAAVAPVQGGYGLTAAGASPYGPLAFDAVVRTGHGPLSIDIRRAALGGLNLSGHVARSAAGPFSGALTVSGDGLAGQIRLSAAGAVQAVQAMLQANQARIPLSTPVTIAAGTLNGRAVLYPHAPTISAQADLTGVRRAGAAVSSLRVNGSYRNGSGQVSLAARGEDRFPFRIAAEARLAPQSAAVSGDGTVNGVAFRLAQPALLQHQGRIWRLQPTTILLRDGRVDLSGALGNGASLQARLQNLDLRLAQAIRPTLGLAGKASGTADLALAAGGGAPSGHLALQVTGLTRTSATTVSEPVDVNVLGSLAGAGGDIRAAVRQRGEVVGRLVVRLAMPAMGPLSQRLKAATVSGGIRYRGPAQALWAMTGAGGQDLSGPIAIGADVSGRLDRPQIRGVAHADKLVYENSKYGTRIDDIALDAQFNGTRLQIVRLTGATASGGTLSASGHADLSAADGWPVDLQVKLDRAQLARSNDLGARLSGTISVTNSKAKGALIAGDLTVDQARYQIVRQGAAQVPTLEGVHWKGQPLVQPSAPAPSGPPSQWRLDVKVHAANQIMVSGMGLNAEWKADLDIVGDLKHPRVVGDVRSVRGSFSFAGRRLTVADTSVIHFDGAEPPNPTLDISASADVNGVTATVTVAGTAKHPQISFTSTPALPEDEVLSRLLFGASQPQLSPLQAIQLAASLNALRGGGGGLNPLAKMSRGLGLENLRVVGADAQTGAGTSVGAGKYISSNIYVDIVTDARGYTATQIEVALTRALSILSQVSTYGGANGSVQYTHRY